MKPWEDIPLPDQQASFRYQLADIDHPFEFFWAKNRIGQYAFRFKGDFPVEVARDAPEMSGILTSAETIANWSYFNLALEDPENADIFYSLCTSLLRATRVLREGEDEAGIQLILKHLLRWQEILKAGRSRKLGEAEQVGLLGELLVLRDIFLANLDSQEAISCWTGPFPDEQDFGYSNSLVEVKTTRSTRDREFRISSLEQLDTTSGRITVIFQTVAVFDDAPPHAISLNELVREIEETLEGDLGLLTEFHARLKLMRYQHDPEYDRRHYVPASRRFLEVRDDFPRIEQSDVRTGVVKGAYSVLVEACLPFELEEYEAIRRILEGVEGVDLDRVEPDISNLILMPESTELEFKSSLRWSYREEKKDKVLESVVIKTIAALANTRGGTLVIGVDDDGTLLGLDPDYHTLSIQQNSDGFLQHLTQLITDAFGLPFMANNVAVTFENIEGKELCLIKVRRQRPIVHVEKTEKSGQKSKVYFVRMGNTSKELPVEQIIQYNQES